MKEENDKYYVEKILEGDTNAFEFIVDTYKDLVFSLTFKTLKNREIAEEAAQDAFLKIFRSLQKFNWDSKFSTWIYKITYNTCLDYIKKTKKDKDWVYMEDLSHQAINDIEHSLEALNEDEKNEKIQECILQLPSEDAFFITLYYFEDQSIDDISKILNMSQSNVKIKLFRCRKKLAVILKSSIEPEILDYYE
ncbi:sigma-70 family RNA polymerase sigma factor [Lacihabitans sp. LS3-19]|uniref:RNA polymerase sigma factor n=1 Tax=Lacihabitans sp. LS3-19 TaxID=2487335 RepID=UPI0020CBE8DC|nr:sigma-70 family RNA polymerase sigma factor [Lacihabitans sp. LS3-19]MCP9767219.1 sigma-70 family RNA polymerase sigma factor [Lacihabitans sp. LS3-19]